LVDLSQTSSFLLVVGRFTATASSADLAEVAADAASVVAAISRMALHGM
jgi:hypothetical protein